MRGNDIAGKNKGISFLQAGTFTPKSIFAARVLTFLSSSFLYLPFLILLPGTLFAQSLITTEYYIKEKLASAQGTISQSTSSTSFKTGWLNEVALRTKTNEFDLTQQSYALRFRPNSKQTRKAQVQLYRQLQEESILDQETYKAVFLQMAYEDWLAIYETYHRLQLSKELLIIYQDIETVQLELGQIDALNIKDLLEVQRDITDTEVVIQTLNHSMAFHLQDVQPDFSDMIGIEIIDKTINQTSNSGKIKRFADQKHSLKAELLASELALKHAERKQWLDFLQVEYEGPASNGFQEFFSIGASINLPFATGSHLQTEQLKIEQQQLGVKNRVEQAIEEEKITRKKQRLRTLLQEEKLFKTLMDKQYKRALEVITITAQKEGANPLLELYTNVERMKQQMDLLSLQTTIYEAYIEYLALTEELFVRPFKNVLRK